MDEIELLKKGGENGPVFIAEKSDESELIKRCLLPLEDENHMPPKGKTQLSEGQVAILSWWIDQGAPVDKKVAELKTADAVKPALAALGKPQSAEGNVSASIPKDELASLNVSAPNASDIEALKKVGVLVTPIATSSHLLDINAVNASSLTDRQLMLLEPLSEQIVWLKLNNTRITDQAANTLSQLKNLQKLHLENTAISDVSLEKIKDLPRLTYLNLVGTKITDQGLKELAAAKKLTRLHLWKTNVTETGVSALKQANSALEITTGITEQQIAEFVKVGQNATKPEDAKKK